jgi:hypothetical protein
MVRQSEYASVPMSTNLYLMTIQVPVRGVMRKHRVSSRVMKRAWVTALSV